MSAFTYVDGTVPCDDEYSVNLVPGPTPLDFTTVTAATFVVKKPNGVIVTWVAAMSNATPTMLTLAYSYLPGDRNVKGPYAIYARLAVPSGTGFVRTTVDFVDAKGEFDG